MVRTHRKGGEKMKNRVSTPQFHEGRGTRRDKKPNFSQAQENATDLRVPLERNAKGGLENRKKAG